MIRWLGHTLRLLLALAVLGWVGWRLWPLAWAGWTLFDPRGGWKVDPRLAEAVAETVYLLEERRWLEFSAASQGDYLKVVSNANLAPTTVIPVDAGWPYALEYQLLDGAGRVLKTAVHHQHATISEYQPPDASKPLVAAFYLNRESQPADGRLIAINRREAPGATRLRLRLAERPAAIEAVVARVYAQEHLFDTARDYHWQRVSHRLREQLAQASVYGPELLSLAEQSNLLRQIWSPRAPLGIEGKDYRARMLYVLSDIEAEPRRPPVLPAGLYLDPNQHGTLAVPEPGGIIDLELLDVAAVMAGAGQTPPTAADPNPARTVRLLWHGWQRSRRAEHTVTLTGPITRWSGPLDAGLIEAMATQPVVARASLRQEHQQALDLIQEPVYLRLYTLGLEQVLEFDVAHVGEQPTFWRVDLRLAPPDPAATGTARLELLDERGAVLQSRVLPVPGWPSVYDWLTSRKTFFDRISEPASYAFVLPATVVKARLRAETPLLAAAYTRPPDLPRSVRVPEDYRPDDRRERGQPFWFPVLPANTPTLLREGRSALMVTQSRPPELDPDILAGRYDWQDYYPEGPWRARYLLNPRDPEAPLRTQALDNLFQPVSTDVPTRLRLQGQPGRSTVEPTLLGLRDSDAPCTVRVVIDGATAYSGVVAVRRAAIRLPPLSAGPHTLTVSASRPGRWLLSNVGAAGGAIRRLAYRLDGDPLEFVYPKTTAGEEILTGVLQMPFGTVERGRVRATVEIAHTALLGPARRLTAREWRYDILPDNRHAVPVLDTSTEQVGLGQRFFLPLGEDLPPGSYRIRMRLERGNGYLTLYRVIPGLTAAFELFNEDIKR